MPNQSIVFSTPRGQIIKTKDGSARLEWTPEFGKKWSGHFSRAQKFVDSEVLRLCRPYTPFQTGSLSRSGDLGTVAGKLNNTLCRVSILRYRREPRL